MTDQGTGSGRFESDRWRWWRRAVRRSRVTLVLLAIVIVFTFASMSTVGVSHWLSWAIIGLAVVMSGLSVWASGTANDRDDAVATRDERLREYRERQDPEA